MKLVLFLTIALPAGLGIAMAQDQQPAGYHAVNCIKVKDGKMAEYREFMQDNRKLAQMTADSGRMMVGYRLRSIMPAGEAAACDFVLVSIFKGAPPPPPAPESLADALLKAHVSMSPAEYRAKQAAVGKLVSTEMWRTDIQTGDIQKGDYMFVNHMKVHDFPTWMEMERSIWKPMAEAWIKEGSQRAWLVNRAILPGGDDRKYQAITLDVYPSWEATFKPRPTEKMFKQIHPDKNMTQVFEKLGKSRSLAVRQLMVVEDKIVPSTNGKTGGVH
jgi:hypothetical protein